MEQSTKDVLAKLETPSIVNSQFAQLLNSLSGLRVISNLGSQTLSYDKLIDTMMQSIIEHLEAEKISLYLIDNDALKCIATLDWDGFANNRSSINKDPHLGLIHVGIIGKAIATQKIKHILNCNTSDEDLTHYKNSGTGSLICAPILINGMPFGVIELIHPEPNHFSSWQEHSVVIYADLFGMNLNNHKLMHDMQNIVDIRTKELQNALEESESLRARYEEMSVIDSLTKLYNRRYFYSEVTSGMARAKRYSQPFSILLMDLDKFKNVNDTFGHECGDKVLIDVAKILTQFTREGDTLARLGGEEFVLALPETTEAGAHKLAERIISTFENNDWQCNGSKMKITISIGLSSLKTKDNDDPNQDDDFQVNDILREADRALYFVKEHGRNNIKSFSEIS